MHKKRANRYFNEVIHKNYVPKNLCTPKGKACMQGKGADRKQKPPRNALNRTPNQFFTHPKCAMNKTEEPPTVTFYSSSRLGLSNLYVLGETGNPM